MFYIVSIKTINLSVYTLNYIRLSPDQKKLKGEFNTFI